MGRIGTIPFYLAVCLVAGCSLAGCATSRPQMNKSLMADRGTAARNLSVPQRYLVSSPDELEITVAEAETFHAVIGPDGRVDLGRLGKMRVEGLSVNEIAKFLGDHLRVPADQIGVKVVEYRSQVLYLFGEVNGLQRAVAYHGPETVLDLLQRTGGITPGAAPEKVYVVRSRIADGERPEIFHVDLQAIVMQHDERTNIRLQPFDQVHVGETSQSKLERCLPRWLRPLYRALCGTRPAEREGRRQSKQEE